MQILSPRRKVSSKDKIETFARIVLFASDFFERIIGATLDAVENEFLIKSDISDSESNQLSSMTRALDVKKHKTKILQSFNDAFVQAFTNSDLSQSKTEEQEDFGISLMGEAEIQENLLVDNLTYRVSDHFQPLLQTITKGIVRISSELNALPEPLILSPAKIGGIFQKAIECLCLPFAYKPLIYNTLFNVGFGKLQELYCGILTLLMQSEIITPEESPIAANPELVSQYKTRIPPDDTFDDDNTLELDDDPNDYTISDMTLSDGTLDMGLAELIHHPISAGKIPRKPIPATEIREELFEKDTSTQLLYKLITHKQHNPTCKGLSNAAVSELMFFLSKLQTNPIQGHEHPNQPRAISHAVDEALKTMDAVINRQLSDIEYNIIQMTNRCFIAILDDSLLPNPIKSQISHLQIPYIKAALLDTMLFIDEAHPCRLFLDEIAHLGIGATQISLTECGHITAAVQYLVDHFKSDLKIFKHSYKKLRNIRKRTEEKALLRERKRLPAAEKQAHLLFRKSLISQVLREALREKHFPKALHTLTLKGFTKILDRRFVKSGLFSTEFYDALKLFCFIVESVQPNDSVQELHRIFGRIPRFIAKTRAMLAEIYSKSDTRKLLTGLEGFYLEKARSFKQKLDQLDAEPFFEADGNGYTSFDENSDHIFKRCLAATPSPAEILSKQPSYLKCGSWFDIDTGQDARLHRLKLVSILENTAQLIFLNSSGNEILIQNASEFIEQINCERSRKLDVQHLFGKALAIAITNMQLSKTDCYRHTKSMEFTC